MNIEEYFKININMTVRVKTSKMDNTSTAEIRKGKERKSSPNHRFDLQR